MQIINKNLILMLAVLTLGTCTKATIQEELEAIFTKRGVEGTIFIINAATGQKYVAYPERAKTPFLPASTFKIPNTLIAMEEAVISSPDEVFKWDGEVRFVDAWNQDHSLRTAFPVSCVWFYQELARRVGDEKYQNHLKQLNYGNMQTGPDVTRFWLNGELRITAEDQISFLENLYNNDLPFHQDHLRLVKDIMIVEQSDEYTLRAKTGWAVRGDGQHTWWVGYVEKQEQVWFFATNIEITSNEQAKYHKEITRQALKLIGVIPTKG